MLGFVSWEQFVSIYLPLSFPLFKQQICFYNSLCPSVSPTLTLSIWSTKSNSICIEISFIMSSSYVKIISFLSLVPSLFSGFLFRLLCPHISPICACSFLSIYIPLSIVRCSKDSLSFFLSIYLWTYNRYLCIGWRDVSNPGTLQPPDDHRCRPLQPRQK